MLEKLDDAVFANLEDAYGPAVDVGPRLRVLAEPDLEAAQNALRDLEAGIFHQGTYYSAAAAAVPFLIEIAGARLPIRGEVLTLLAAMAGAPPDSPAPFDPFVFTSTPGAPTYPEAVAAVEAVRAGRVTYLAALDAPEPEVRVAAALVLSRSAQEADALASALARNDDETTEVALRLALHRAGGTLPPSTSRLGSAVSRALAGGFDESALETLLLEPTIPCARLPFFDGELASLAEQIVRAHATDPRAWPLLWRTLDTRLARGERIEEIAGPTLRRVRDETPPPRPDLGVYGRDAALRTIVLGLVHIAFGELASAPGLLRRDQLDERMREVLALTCRFDIPVPVRGAPWFDAAAMRRFLDGGGALDREVTIDRARIPLYVALHHALHAQKPSKKRVKKIVDAALAALDDEALFELVVDVEDNAYDLAPYGSPAPALEERIEADVLPRLASDTARFERLARRLASETSVTGPQARFALTPWIRACTPTPPELDALAGSALVAMRAAGVPWLRTFPEPRRSAMIARFGNAYVLSLFESACEEMPAALARAFVAPECQWLEHDAETVLARLPVETLRTMAPTLTGFRATLVRRVLRTLTGEGVLVLTMRAGARGVHATLVDWTRKTWVEADLSSQPRIDELAPIVRACADLEDAVVELAGNLDSTTEYRVMRLLPEAGFRGTLQAGNRSMRSGG